MATDRRHGGIQKHLFKCRRWVRMVPFRLENEEMNFGAYGTSLQWFPFLNIIKQSKETRFPGVVGT